MSVLFTEQQRETCFFGIENVGGFLTAEEFGCCCYPPHIRISLSLLCMTYEADLS